MGFTQLRAYPHSFNSANQVAVPLIFSQEYNMIIPEHFMYNIEREKEFERQARAVEREALCRAVERSVVQQKLARRQLKSTRLAFIMGRI